MEINLKEGETITINGIVHEYKNGLILCYKSQEPEKPKKWVPKKGEVCWFINSTNDCHNTYWTDHELNLARLLIGNVYQTEELAQIQADKNALIAEIFNYCDEKGFELAGAEYEGRIYCWYHDRYKKHWEKGQPLGYFNYFFPNFINESDRNEVFEKFKDQLDIFNK